MRTLGLVALVLVLDVALPACGDDDAAADRDTRDTRDTASDTAGPDATEPSDDALGTTDAPDAPDAADDDADTRGPDVTVDADGIGHTTIAVGELTFVARTIGPERGELVLLLHGFPATSASWTLEMKALAAAGYRAVAFDQRGYSPGARPADDADYAMPHLVDDVIGVADALGATTFHLVGHDWGAAVAWTVAALHPERLKSLTTLSVPHPDAYARVYDDPASCQSASSSYIAYLVRDDAARILLAANAQALRIFLGGLDEASVDAYLAVLGSEDALDAALAWYRVNIGQPGVGIEATIGPVAVRTLFLWGRGDPAICEDGPNLTAEYVTGPYDYEVIDDVGHWLPELAADTVTDHLLAHLADH